MANYNSQVNKVTLGDLQVLLDGQDGYLTARGGFPACKLVETHGRGRHFSELQFLRALASMPVLVDAMQAAKLELTRAFSGVVAPGQGTTSLQEEAISRALNRLTLGLQHVDDVGFESWSDEIFSQSPRSDPGIFFDPMTRKNRLLRYLRRNPSVVQIALLVLFVFGTLAWNIYEILS